MLLSKVQRIMNASTHGSIGVAPAKLLHGQAFDLNRGKLTDISDADSPDVDLPEWIREQATLQRELHEEIEAILRASDENTSSPGA